MGRTFDGHILDMFEFGIENVKLLSDFKNLKVTPGVKPILIFSGDAFETEFEYMKLKNYFIDLLSGPKTDGVRLSGLESVIQVVAAEGKIHFRHFRILLKKSGSRIPRIELEEIGPRFDLSLRRHKLASHDLYKHSMRQPQALRPKKEKNVDVSALGTTFGRIHMERQDYGKLAVKQVRQHKQDRRRSGNQRTMGDRIKDIYGPVAGREEKPSEDRNDQGNPEDKNVRIKYDGVLSLKNGKRASDDPADFGRKKQPAPYENNRGQGHQRRGGKRLAPNRGNRNGNFAKKAKH